MSDPTPPEDYTYPEDYVPPPPFPSRIESITLHVTKGTPPNEVPYTVSIPYAFNGENSVAITNQQLIDDFNNKPPGTTYSYHVTTNYVPSSFPTGDVLTTPTVSNQSVKAIPKLDIIPLTYNYTTEDHYISETVNSNSNGQLSFQISNLTILSIEPGTGKIIAVGSGTAILTITQSSTAEYEGAVRYEKVTVASTPQWSTILTTILSVEPLWLRLLSNNVTVHDTVNRRDFPGNLPVFVHEDPRGTGTSEWFAIVDDRHRGAITSYARGFLSTLFTPPGQSTPVPFNNIVTTHITDMSGMFQNVFSFNHPIGCWDTRRVLNMRDMFFGAVTFNQPLISWDVSNVMNMTGMFFGAAMFNQPLISWDVSDVRYMAGMFSNAGNFNQPLISWDVSNVINMSAMFAGAFRFNQPLISWNVFRVQFFQNFRSGSSLSTPNTPVRFVFAA